MKSKFKYILGLLALLISPTLKAQRWVWNAGGEGAGNAAGYALAVDKVGNKYMGGEFAGSLMLDTVSLVSHGLKDGFIAKFSADNHLLWAMHCDEAVRGLAVDNQGGGYACGYFADTGRFGSFQLVSSGRVDAYVLKLDAGTGVPVWVKKGGGIYDDLAYGLAVAQNGDVLVTGEFASYNGSPPPRGIAVFEQDTLRSLADDGGYLARYSKDGVLKWIKSMDTKLSIAPLKIALDGSGNIFVVGHINGVYQQKVYFDTLLLVSDNIGFVIGAGFLVKYDSTGKALWATTAGGKNTVDPQGGGFNGHYGLAVDGEGSSYVCGGYITCDLKIGPYLVPGEYGIYNGYVAKYASDGTLAWVKTINGNEHEFAQRLSTDEYNNLYVLGIFGSPATFGGHVITAPGGGYSNLFVSKWDKGGNELNTAVATGIGWNDYQGDVTCGPDGTVYITGDFSAAQANFGFNPLYNTGGRDAYIASLTFPALGITNAPAAAPITLFPNPSSGKFTVHVSVQQPGQLDIFNLLGNRVYSCPIAPGQGMLNIDAGSLPNGIYNLRYSGRDRTSYNQINIIR